MANKTVDNRMSRGEGLATTYCTNRVPPSRQSYEQVEVRILLYFYQPPENAHGRHVIWYMSYTPEMSDIKQCPSFPVGNSLSCLPLW